MYMKFLHTTFNDYIQGCDKVSLHPSLTKTFSTFPTNIDKLKNIIFYGPPGVGKYTQMLNCIKRYSPSNLKYEKKLTCVFNKTNYYFKISDIHFEVDMALLGCNSKMLWNEIYINVIDILSARTNKTGIIVCKNFHKIHSELLECFYSYIQKNCNEINIIYIILTEHISFISDDILNTFNIIPVARPTKSNYNKILDTKLVPKFELSSITNIKNLNTDTLPLQHNVNIYTQQLYQLIMTPSDIKFNTFRDRIYDIFIYDMDVGYIVWKLITMLTANNIINSDALSGIFIDTFTFLQYYNNNYRPIYHLERYLYNIINKIHGF